MDEEHNLFLLAADDSNRLLTLLRKSPAKAAIQDEHGYSLIHAAASYNCLALLQALVREFGVNVNIEDEDHETPLFVVETIEAARLLVDELGANVHHRGSDGLTAAEKIEAEGEFPIIAVYLKTVTTVGHDSAQPMGAPTTASPIIKPSTNHISTMVGIPDPTDSILDEDFKFRCQVEEFVLREGPR